MVTGASAGLGKEFAVQLAAEGHDLVLVARSEERLRELADEVSHLYGVAVEVLVADLGKARDCAIVEARLKSDEPIGILVNNAGFGVNEAFVGGSLKAEQQMLDVLVTVPMRLCHAVLPGMVARGSGSVINVSSVAGWITSGTYSAAKAYLTTFTEGLAGELAGTGVTATAVCPGFIHTEFHERAGMDMSSVPEQLWLTPKQVVRQALRDAQRGRVISVPGRQYQLLSTFAQYAPRPIVRRISRMR